MSNLFTVSVSVLPLRLSIVPPFSIRNRQVHLFVQSPYSVGGCSKFVSVGTEHAAASCISTDHTESNTIDPDTLGDPYVPCSAKLSSPGTQTGHCSEHWDPRHWSQCGCLPGQTLRWPQASYSNLSHSLFDWKSRRSASQLRDCCCLRSSSSEHPSGCCDRKRRLEHRFHRLGQIRSLGLLVVRSRPCRHVSTLD